REVAEGIDLSGKVALVTGGSSGLGQETARVLAGRGAHVIRTARDMPKGEAVAAGIRASTGNQHVEVEELELGSLKHIRAFAQRFLARHPTLHILVNNAGVMACPPAKTADGFELQFGSNHVGHFLTTCLLAPALRRAAPSRVVSVSSRGHHMSPVVFDASQGARRSVSRGLSRGRGERRCRRPRRRQVVRARPTERRASLGGLGEAGGRALRVEPVAATRTQTFPRPLPLSSRAGLPERTRSTK